MRAVRVLLWPAAVAVGLAAEAVYYGFGDPTRWFPDLVTGWTMIACGLIAWRSRPESRIGALLTASGFCWFLGNFSRSDVAAVAWIAQHGVYLHRGPLVHAIITYPTGRTRSRAERVAVTAGYAVAVVEPMWADELSATILSVLLVGFTVWLYAQSVAGERRARLTTVWAAAAVGLVVVGGAMARLVFTVDVAENALRLAYEAALCGIALALAGGVMSRSWDRAVVADLVVELGEERSDRLHDGLARALGDPSLDVGYWSPETERFVDSSGRPLALPTSGADRATTQIDGASGAIGVLIHNRTLLDDPGLVESIATAARLASVHARLQAEVRAQISALDASRRRIVTAGDEEHRRLERRLRDGPEHRLENLASQLDAAHRLAGTQATTEPLDKVRGQLVEALKELRALAAGLHPRLLTESGLGGALDALAARSATPVRVAVTCGRLPAEFEAAVYFVCSEALANVDKHAAATSASIAVSISDRVLHFEVSDDGAGGADPAAGSGLLNLIDRVHALGGTLDVASSPLVGTRVVAEFALGDQTG